MDGFDILGFFACFAGLAIGLGGGVLLALAAGFTGGFAALIAITLGVAGLSTGGALYILIMEYLDR